MTLAAWITVLATVVVGTSGSGGAVYWLLSRKSQKVQDDKTKSERDNFMAEAAEKWQKILDTNATAAYRAVDARCKRCETDLSRVVAVVVPMLMAAGTIVELVAQGEPVSPEAMADFRAKLHAVEREVAKHTP